MDIEGNEHADEEAKRAAIDPEVCSPFIHRPLKSSRIQHIKAMAKVQWNKTWTQNTKTSKHLRRISPKYRTQNGPKLYNTLSSRSTCAQIVQLRTGHCGLNSYLHRFGKRGSSYCGCGYGKETVEHFILECPKYKEQRKELRKSVGTWKLRIDMLLGDVKLLKYMTEYIKATGRMVNKET